MKRLAAVTCALVVLFVSAVQAAETFDRVCGVLQSETRDHLSGSSYQPTFRALRRTEVRIYRRVAHVGCCRSVDLVAKSKSGLWGDFKFKKLADGDYWIAASANGRESSMPLRVDQKSQMPSECKDRNFVIAPDGQLGFGVTIEVD